MGESRLVGGFEWMHLVGYGHLGEAFAEDGTSFASESVPREPVCLYCGGTGKRGVIDAKDWSARSLVVCEHCEGSGLDVELGVSG